MSPMNAKKIVPLVIVTLVISTVSVIFLMNLMTTTKDKTENGSSYEGQRKAIILCSANDFYGSTEDEFNDGNDAQFTSSMGNWAPIPGNGEAYSWYDGTGPITDGYIYFETTDIYTNANYTYDWNKYQTLREYYYYNVSAHIQITDEIPIAGGARFGLQWKNSTGHMVKTDWSENVSIAGPWIKVNAMGVCNNDTGNEITNLTLIFSVNATFSAPSRQIRFDDVIVDRWISVNLTDPNDPPPPPPQGKMNSDGFPAQALQVYWILKNHGYSDDNIFLMLYYKDDTDGIININANDAIPDDLIGAIIDVANDSVTADRFKQELNVSISGSFASKIKPEDQLIIYMADHGSNKILGDGNATFHFESDGSNINETEFYDLVKKIDCVRMLINLDCCFSGNFLNCNRSIGLAWYDIPNSILVSSSSNVLSWYWVNTNNGDGWAGSWFFHIFWDELDKDQTIQDAYNSAINFPPTVNPPTPPTPVGQIQKPLMKDNLGIANSWSFKSTPKL